VVTGGLFRPAWPPLVGLAAGLIVFVVVLLDTPPGFSAVGMLLTGSARGVQGQAAAYAAGAAAALALVTLLGVSLTLAVVAWLIGAVRQRRRG
jgi:hypothetical protein